MSVVGLGNIWGTYVLVLTDIFDFYRSFFICPTRSLHLSRVNLFGSGFLRCPEKSLLIIPRDLLLRLEHELLNFLRRSYDLNCRRDLCDFANDDFEPAYPGFVKFTEVVNYLHNMQSPETYQSCCIFGFTDAIAGYLVVTRECAVQKVDPV
jgi:hypothetical protein